MGNRQGFTLLEMLTVVGVVGVLASAALFGLTHATRTSRQSGIRFSIVQALNQAPLVAASTGTDVYVIFANTESTRFDSLATAPRVIVYADPDLALLSSTDLMAVVNANPQNIRDELNAVGRHWGATGLAFRDPSATSVAPCNLARLPNYLSVTATRQSQRLCAGYSFCTFCELQNGRCVGAIRFQPDGTARMVTGGGGRGGLIQLVQPDDRTRTMCIAIGEPNGQAITVRD